MTITVTAGGTPVSANIHFTRMSPWTSQPKYNEHEIYGSDRDILHYRGRKSRTCTLEGYCLRNTSNLAVLESLVEGVAVAVTHDVEGTRSGLCTACSTAPTEGGIYITFTMTLVEQ